MATKKEKQPIAQNIDSGMRHTIADWDKMTGFGEIDPKTTMLTREQYLALQKKRQRSENLHNMTSFIGKIGAGVSKNFNNIQGFSEDNVLERIAKPKKKEK